MTKKLNYIDLFAGAGGLSEGFCNAGFNPIAHVEMDEAACNTLKTRTAYNYLKGTKKFDLYIDYLKGSITRADLYSLIPNHLMSRTINHALGKNNNKEIYNRIDCQIENKNIDLIIGGPPCQAYSLVGRARSDYGMINDSRNNLYLQYAGFLKKYSPKMFVFENVLGLRSADGGNYFKKIILAFNNLGYEVADFVLNANDFNVLQNRKRIILIGYKRELNLAIPDFNTIRKKQYQVQAIFQDLPKLQAGGGLDKYYNYLKPTNEYLKETGIRNGINILTQHISRPNTDQDKEIYRIAVENWQGKKRLSYIDLPERLKTHANTKSFFDRFKVVASDLNYSQTVVAHIAKDGHYYIHPDIKQNRSITIREAARLQSFPDDFYFEGIYEGRNRTAALKQIGNAVPPLLAKAIAKKLNTIL